MISSFRGFSPKGLPSALFSAMRMAECSRLLASWISGNTLKRARRFRGATLIVTAANDFMRKIHDRMPVLLERQDHDAWLTGKAGVELLRSAPNDILRMGPVSTRVNVSGRGDDDPSLIEPVEANLPIH
jgi:putative SOS response-associated peptidase YedK